MTETEGDGGQADQGPATTAGSRERSTIGFPYDDLESAVGVARAVYELGGKCETDQLAAQLRYSSVDNGAFRMRMATARTFGVIAVSREGISLAPTGQLIVDPHQESRGRAEAFLNVPLYRAVYEKFKGTILPPIGGLERVFADLGVAAKQTDKARQAFQRSAEQAGYFGHGKDRLVGPSLVATARRAEDDGRIEERTETGVTRPANSVMPTNSALSSSLIRGLFEQLPTPGSEWSDQEQKSWLELAKAILPAVYKTARPALAERATPRNDDL